MATTEQLIQYRSALQEMIRGMAANDQTSLDLGIAGLRELYRQNGDNYFRNASLCLVDVCEEMRLKSEERRHYFGDVLRVHLAGGIVMLPEHDVRDRMISYIMQCLNHY